MKKIGESVTRRGLLLAVSTDAGIDVTLSRPDGRPIGAISVSWDAIREAMPADESPIKTDIPLTIHVDARELRKLREVISEALHPKIAYMEGEMDVMRKDAANFTRNAIGVADDMIGSMLGEQQSF